MDLLNNFHFAEKKQIILVFTFFSLLLFSKTNNAQIGIGTTSPTKDLDINGEIRIRSLPTQNTSDSFTLTADQNGNIGRSASFMLHDFDVQIAASPVSVNVISASYQIRNNIDLGLSTTVTIPANKTALVIINYSVPVGISSYTQPKGYYGIKFFKDEDEAESGSRKFSIIFSEGTTHLVTISNVYSENFTSSQVERIVTYTLNGYIEQGSEQKSTTHTYRFNMWSTTPPNFNWGRATLTKQVFIK